MRAPIDDRKADDPWLSLLTTPGPRGGREEPKEVKLLTAEVRYRALVEQIPAITFVAALDQDIQEFYVSPQIEAMLGFTQKEWLENPILWYEQLHEDDRERWQSEFAQTVFGGVAFRSEYRFLARDGHVVWVRGEAQMVCDAEGNPLFLQGIAFDITEQKEAEAILRRSREQLEEEVRRRTSELGRTNLALKAEVAERTRADLALRDREAKLRSIVENAVDGIIVIGQGGAIESFNPAAERIFGHAAAEVIGSHFRRLLPAPDREEPEGDRPRDFGGDVTGRRKDGSTFPMELSVSETPTPEGIKYTGILRDVTQRKRDEAALIEAKLAAEAASRLKGEFLANMSHEIRTPMNGIIGMTELALDTELAPDQREYLETVRTSADSLLTLINDILDFSKIEAGKLDLDPIDFDLRDMLSDALKPMAVRAHEKGLELACEVAPDVPEVLVGDIGRLRQVLINLVGNAIKFTPGGEVVVRIAREGGTAASNDRLQFSVEDTGIGIPQDKQHLIFESFTQADGSTTRRFGGTGLGLSISRRLVELMGGRIWLESEPSRSSTFHFTASLPPSSRIILGPRPDAVEVRGLRVLIVDDNATNLRILEKTAIRWGMEPTLCDSGPAALEAMSRAVAEGHAFPIVLLDAMMPDMDGFEVIRRVHADASLVGATIMMLSSAAQLSEVDASKDLGLSGFLIKPVRQSELLAAMMKALSHATRPILEPEAIIPSDAIRPSDAEPTSPLRILLAEDNIVNQRLALRLLEKQGHRVSVAGDGQQALVLMTTSRFDLVIMDVQMPVMDGFEATAALRALEARTGGHLPVIALTANAMKGDREHCLRAGFDDYVTKPIRWPHLAAAIEAQTRSRPRVDEPERHDAPPEGIFNLDAALERLDGDVELLKEVAEIFLDDCPRLGGLLADAVQRGDAKPLKIAAHTLRGAATTFASRAVEEVASRLERLAASGDTSGASGIFSPLPGLLDQLEAELRRFVDRVAAQ